MLVSSSRRSTNAARGNFPSPTSLIPGSEPPRATPGSADSDADPSRLKRFATRTVLPALQARKQQQPQGNALIELGRQAQQLRNSHNEIRMELVESRLMKLHLAIVVTSLINLISVIVEQEISWRKWYFSDAFPFGLLRATDDTANTLKIISSIITAALEAMLIYMYYLFHQLRISKSELESKLGKSLKDSRFSVLRELFKGLPYHSEAMTAWHPNWLLLVEMTIFALHPFPYVHGTFKLDILGIQSVYQVEQIFILCMFLRFYTVVRYLREREAVQMRPFRRLLNGYGMVVSTTSLVKRFINLHPFRFVLMIYAFNYIINIYCLRMGDIAVVSKLGQKTTSATNVEITTQPMYVWNNGWMIQSSISTVGYGDQYPYTHFGRAFVLIAVFTQICMDSFTVATMNSKTSMSLIEATITKQLSLILLKRHSKSLAAFLIFRWWRFHRSRLALHDRVNHIYGRGYGRMNAAASQQTISTEMAKARVNMWKAQNLFREHIHTISKLNRPTEGNDTEIIFAALSGTFDQAFEVFFSNLGTIVNSVAGPMTERRKSDAIMGGRRVSTVAADDDKEGRKIVIRSMLSDRLTKMAYEHVGLNANRQKPLLNPSVSPFLKAESQTVDVAANLSKSLLAKIELRLLAIERGVEALEQKAKARRIDKFALQWAHKELHQSIAEFSNLARMSVVAAAAPDVDIMQSMATQRSAQQQQQQQQQQPQASPPHRTDPPAPHRPPAPPSQPQRQTFVAAQSVVLPGKRTSTMGASKHPPAIASPHAGSPSTKKLSPLKDDFASQRPLANKAPHNKPVSAAAAAAAVAAVESAGAVSAFKARRTTSTLVSKS